MKRARSETLCSVPVLIFGCQGGSCNGKKEAHHKGDRDYLCDFFFLPMFSVWLFIRAMRNDMTKISIFVLVNGDCLLNKIPFSPR